MKIAVTGGSGFIGSRVVKRLLEKGYEIVVVDIRQCETINDVEMVTADITDLEQAKSALHDIDIVYHIAGLVLEEVRKHPYDGMRVNVGGTQNVLEACRQTNVKKILFASSFYVYDGIDDRMIVNEETTLNILNMELFGATKLVSEAIIREYCAKYGLNYVIFRFGSAYGAGRCSNIVKTFINSAMNGEPIEIWGEGKRKNQYTYVDDIAEGCLLGINVKNETFNLCSPEVTSIGQLAELLKRKYEFEIVYNTMHKEGKSMCYMSSRKAMEKLGWEPISLEEGVEKTIAEIKAEPYVSLVA